MRVAEQIVKVAQRLLICANQERANVIRLVLIKLMQLDKLFHVAGIHKAIHAAV